MIGTWLILGIGCKSGFALFEDKTVDGVAEEEHLDLPVAPVDDAG